MKEEEKVKFHLPKEKEGDGADILVVSRLSSYLYVFFYKLSVESPLMGRQKKKWKRSIVMLNTLE